MKILNNRKGAPRGALFASRHTKDRFMKRIAALALALAGALLVSACQSDGDGPGASPAGIWQTGPVLNGENRSIGVPDSFATGQLVSFPDKYGKIGYVTQYCGQSLLGKTVSLSIEIVGDGTLDPSDGSVREARVRLYFQRAGDNYSGQPPYNSYRQWSRAYVALTPGKHTLSAPVVFDQWINVQGQRDQASFEAAAGNCAKVGFTFGGQFAGHGVYRVNGMAAFRVLSFSVK